MPDVKSWIDAFRLRTLPLALSSIIMGSLLAVNQGTYRWQVILLAASTTLFLQILSNLANDYGDAMKGTDNENRLGPLRTVQSGAISPQSMKSAIWIFVGLSLISGVLLIVAAFGSDWLLGLLFFGIGLAAIAAAIKYTVGKSAYGYAGFGDLFVFLFFGLIGVAATYYLNTQLFHWPVILPAISMGLFSTAVLNLNNMRDIHNDSLSSKHTLVTRMGIARAKWYHAGLIFMGISAALWYTWISFESYGNLLFLLCIPLFVRDLIAVFNTREEVMLDPFLKRQALLTLLFSVLFGLGLLL